MDPYSTLEVDKAASKEEIKKAYRNKAKKYHPDNKEEGDKEKFQLIHLAYKVLIDDETRKKYDETGTCGSKPSDIEQQALSELAQVFSDVIELLIAQKSEKFFEDIISKISSITKEKIELLKSAPGLSTKEIQ